jgi:hypothetical protein
VINHHSKRISTTGDTPEQAMYLLPSISPAVCSFGEAAVSRSQKK